MLSYTEEKGFAYSGLTQAGYNWVFMALPQEPGWPPLIPHLLHLEIQFFDSKALEKLLWFKIP